MKDWLFLVMEDAALLAAIVAAFVIWYRLRAAGRGVRINAFLLVALILIVLSPLLIKPGGPMVLIPVFVPSLMIGIPLLTPFVVGYFIYRGLASAGLAQKRSGVLALICGLFLLAVATLHVAANVYVTSHHMLGSLANPHVG